MPLFRMHRQALFREYVGWFQSVARTKLCQRWTDADYANMGDSDDDNTLYDTRTREGSHVQLAPILDRVVTIFPTNTIVSHFLLLNVQW